MAIVVETKPKRLMANKKQPRIKVSDQKAMGTEPEWDSNAPVTRSQFAMALNWYNYYFNIRDSKKWILEYMSSGPFTKSEVATYKASNDPSITQTQASIARMIMRGAAIDSKQLDGHIQKVIEKHKPVASETAEKPSPVSHINPLIADLDDLLDQFYRSEYKLEITESDLKIKSHPVAVIREAAQYYKELQSELSLAGSDPDVTEAYERLGKRQMNKYTKLVDMLVEQIENAFVKQKRAKVVRKPRKKKEKSAEQQLKYFKYLESSAEVDAVSISPDKIIGASVLYTYNVKYRRVTLYHAKQGGFSVKGTSLQNVDINRCIEKTVRKPAEVLPFIMKESKARINKMVHDLKTKETTPNVRINANTLLLRVFK